MPNEEQLELECEELALPDGRALLLYTRPEDDE